MSGYHYFGAGNRSATSYGGDLRGYGPGGEGRLRPDGTIVPRNSFIQPVQNRTEHAVPAAVRSAEPACRST